MAVYVHSVALSTLLLSELFRDSTSEIAGYAYILPPPKDGLNGTEDGEVLETTEEGHLVMVNGTLIRIMLKKPFRDSELNELLYVIIVIVFYATALMTLIITQIKRQRREGTDVDYYDEYLQRNQEVKKTCKTATTIVLKTSPPSSTTIATNATASTSVSGPASASGECPSAGLLELPARTRDVSPRMSPRQGHGRGLSGGGGGAGDDFSYFTPSPSPRELSPMLESIPDIGT